ncbi:MAG TPA: tRNA uridine-5-carboxymethylaminomethyl(34) synthesis GTPase MnmE [Firmicutes bacterium]|nr:tRNA uridine-5-carboxymethylaminomethyl(34) synthesis GTPase MnmE [Bacillota bacterium]
MTDTTVAAVSTPRGKGGVAMIRITGPEARAVLSRVFRPKSGRPPEARQAVYGSFFDDGGVFDDGVAVFYAAPASYTGEDTAELCCHGGLLVTERLLSAVLAAGAQPARPGEFSKRAFLNGKLTLTEAEAVAGIIDAVSAKRLEIGVRQAGGSLSRRIDGLYRRLVTLAASMRAYIDYPDEDLADLTPREAAAELSAVRAELDALADSHRYGRAVSEGVRTVLVGRTNTGKSSLLNLLLGFERALVSDEAGTTRDVVSETAVVCGIPLLLADTAGLRAGAGAVERAGIGKSLEQLERAELVLAVFDLSQPLTAEDYGLADRIRALGKAGSTVAVFNKRDLAPGAVPPVLFDRQVCISARTGEGKDALEQAVGALYGGLEPDMDAVITSARQAAALRRASAALGEAKEALCGGAQDAAGTELDAAIAALGETDGRSVSEAVVDEIFSRFCVGK